MTPWGTGPAVLLQGRGRRAAAAPFSRDREPRDGGRRVVRSLQADRSHQPLLRPGDHSRRARSSSRTAPTRRTSRTSRSSGTRWSASPASPRASTATAPTSRTATGGGQTLIKTGKLAGRPASRSQLFGTRSCRRRARSPRSRPRRRRTTPTAPATRTRQPNLNGPAAGAGAPDAVAQVARRRGHCDPEAHAGLHRR